MKNKPCFICESPLAVHDIFLKVLLSPTWHTEEVYLCEECKTRVDIKLRQAQLDILMQTRLSFRKMKHELKENDGK